MDIASEQNQSAHSCFWGEEGGGGGVCVCGGGEGGGKGDCEYNLQEAL